MEKLYIACVYGLPVSRIMLGTLSNQTLRLAELHRFRTPITQTKEARHWNIQEIFAQTVTALEQFGREDVSLHGISCTAWGEDYLLFDRDGALLSPAYCQQGQSGGKVARRDLTGIAGAVVYEETGGALRETASLAQLQAETSKRRKQATLLLPFADGMNHLLGGHAVAEFSSASTTQLFNPVQRNWSRRLGNELKLSPGLLPNVVPSSTRLGALRTDLATQARLDGAQLVASCSYELAAALASRPQSRPGEGGYLRIGAQTQLGAIIPEPVITEAGWQGGFDNETLGGGEVNFFKRLNGLQILEACRTYWLQLDRELSDDVLMHLAATSPAFVAFIDPADIRFVDPAEMPLKIQAYCRETAQEIPRKPGQIFRCVLESLALQYRQAFREMEQHTGSKFTRVHLFGAEANPLLNHFIVNALQVPAVLAAPDSVVLGNVLTQALALGHIHSAGEAQEVLSRSHKLQGIIPQAASWDVAAAQWEELRAGPRAASAAPVAG